MAGGVHAAAVPCIKCAQRADRVSEGLEDDYYQCHACGYQFVIDWSVEGPPQQPCWPITPATAPGRKTLAAQLFGVRSRNTSGIGAGDRAAHVGSHKPWWKFW